MPYPPEKAIIIEDDVRFPEVGYVSSLEGHDVMTDSIVVMQRLSFQPILRSCKFHDPGV